MYYLHSIWNKQQHTTHLKIIMKTFPFAIELPHCEWLISIEVYLLHCHTLYMWHTAQTTSIFEIEGIELYSCGGWRKLLTISAVLNAFFSCSFFFCGERALGRLAEQTLFRVSVQCINHLCSKLYMTHHSDSFVVFVVAHFISGCSLSSRSLFWFKCI